MLVVPAALRGGVLRSAARDHGFCLVVDRHCATDLGCGKDLGIHPRNPDPNEQVAWGDFVEQFIPPIGQQFVARRYHDSERSSDRPQRELEALNYGRVYEE